MQATVRVGARASCLVYGLAGPGGCYIHGQPDWASTSEICVSGSLVNKVGA